MSSAQELIGNLQAAIQSQEAAEQAHEDWQLTNDENEKALALALERRQFLQDELKKREHDLIEGRMTVSQIRPVDIEDLLGRDPVRLDMEAIGRFINDRVILITGAGGSIGAEMCRQICHFRPKRLILVEQAETPLFDIENELRERHPSLSIVPRICDIFDRERVMQVWKKQRPDVVIHAAAHKHVPLMEHNPCEALKNNVLGTRNAADASCAAGVAVVHIDNGFGAGVLAHRINTLGAKTKRTPQSSRQ